MPPIKMVPLPRLMDFFGKSVNELEPGPVRALAARMMTLTAHAMRIEQMVVANVKAVGTLTEQITTLTEIVQTLATGQAPAVEQPDAQQAQPAAPAAQTTAPAPTAEATEESDESEAAFFAKAQQEAEAEVAKINAAQPDVPEVTLLPARSKKVGVAK